MYVTVERSSSDAPMLLTYDKTGRLVQRISFRIPGASAINIYNQTFARGVDGSFAISGSAYTNDSRATVFLAWISPDGSEQVVTRTAPYVARAVTVAPDGVIWTAGHDSSNGSEINPDHLIVRRFDRTGRLLGGAIPRSEFSIERHPAANSYLISSDTRIGWYSEIGEIYIEFALDGLELYRSHIDSVEEVTLGGIALCRDNSLWASTLHNKDMSAAISLFDRQSGHWITSIQLGRVLDLYGCDDEGLITLKKPHTLDWLSRTH
jgi:hypothetical protein